ncbi:unnamed protein product [Penicillium nalgiovense]|nr:unnamed protein product [Penicillium nalgiovense]
MSICLLCYAFPFHVSAITLARSELYPLSDLSCSYVSFLFFFFYPLLSSSAAFSYFIFLYLFSMCLCPYAIGVSRHWVFVCVHSAKKFCVCLSYPYLFPVKTDCRLVQHVFLSCASAFVDSKFLVIVCNNVLYARLVFALRYCRQALHLLVLYSWPFASGSTYINIAPVAGPIGGGPNELEQTWLLGNWSLVVVLLY